MMNTLGWLHSEFGDVAHAMEYDQESAEVGPGIWNLQRRD